MSSCIDFSHIKHGPPVAADAAKPWWVILQYDQRKTGHTALLSTTEPERFQQRGPVWCTQTLIYVGSQAEAEELIKLASQDAAGRQIRGLHSRGPKLDVLSTKYNLRQYSPSLENVTKQSYTLEQFNLGD
jgi:hypothetical protein